MNRKASLKLVVDIKLYFLVLWLVLFIVPAFGQEAKYDMVVAEDGSGDYTSIQAAIDASKSFPYDRIAIFIRNGIYKEKVQVYSWNTKISLIGEDKVKTVITYSDYFDKINRGRNSTFHTYTLLVQGNDFHAENLTIKNDAGPVGQAVALHVEADRASFVNCRFLGNQDTMFASGENSRQYYRNCYVEGTTDFIFGPATAVFEDCHIHSKENSYITAASTPEGVPYGYVFVDCKFTADPEVKKVYLGRPWRNYAKTVFINAELGDHIRPEGWHNWGKPEAESTVFYAEYNSKGPGANSKSRVDWSHQLNKEKSKEYTLDNIFRGWNPMDKNLSAQH